jgi:hypothetical protein
MKNLILTIIIFLLIVGLLSSCDNPNYYYIAKIKVTYTDNTKDTLVIKYYKELYLHSYDNILMDLRSNSFTKNVKSFSLIKEENVLKDTK